MVPGPSHLSEPPGPLSRTPSLALATLHDDRAGCSESDRQAVPSGNTRLQVLLGLRGQACDGGYDQHYKCSVTNFIIKKALVSPYIIGFV
eukprot:3004248-Rhodomonas_salina.1